MLKHILWICIFFTINALFLKAQKRNITASEIDSNLFIFNRNNNLQFSLTDVDLETRSYPLFTPQYQNQLIRYLEKNPYNLDTILKLYEVQGYINHLEGQKNTLVKYKNSIDKILSTNSKDMLGLLHASEYYRLKNNKNLRISLLDSALKHHPNELKVKEFYLDYYLENQNYEPIKSLSEEILNLEPNHLKAIYNLVIIDFYENAYFGIRNNYAIIEKFILEKPDLKSLPIIKTYLETISFILKLTDFGFGEMNFQDWHLPMALKNASDSLYKVWLEHLPYLNNQAAGHSLLMLIKFLEKDTLNASKHFYKAIEQDVFYKSVYYNYYLFQLELKNYKECIKTANLLVQNIPNENHYLLLAKAYFLAQNYYQTEQILKKLLEKPSNEPFVYTALAQYYLKFRKMEEVKKYLDLAKRMNPRDAEYSFTAAMYYVIMNNPKQAKEHLLTYLEFFPKDETALDWLKSL